MMYHHLCFAQQFLLLFSLGYVRNISCKPVSSPSWTESCIFCIAQIASFDLSPSYLYFLVIMLMTNPLLWNSDSQTQDL